MTVFNMSGRTLQSLASAEVEDEFMETYTGARFYFRNPSPESIVIEDIAHALSQQCRYTGHCKHFYSVAEHSTLIAMWAQTNGLRTKQELRTALMHDAAEAYLADISRPVKKCLPDYKVIEATLEATIAERFGLIHPLPTWLKELDARIIKDEREQVMSASGNDWKHDALEPLGVRVTCLHPQSAEVRFLRLFREYAE